MQEIEEFTYKEKNILYFDFSNSNSNDEHLIIVNAAKEIIVNYPFKSVYTITNINTNFYNSQTKEIAVEWMKFNSRYTCYSALFGWDGLKKTIVATVLMLSGRNNVKITSGKKEALEWFHLMDLKNKK